MGKPIDMEPTNPVRVLFLSHNVAWRGGFFRAYHWARSMVRRGHEVTLLSISESRRWGFEVQERDGVRLVGTPDLLTHRLRSGWDPWDTVNRISYLISERFDIVHSVDSRPVSILPALVLKRLRNSRLVLDWGDWWGRGGTIIERSNGLLERAFAPVETFFEEGFRRFADGSVVLTSALRKRALALGVSEDRILQIPHGADVEGIRPRDKLAARARLGLPAGERLVGYVGSILPRDRHLLFEAFEIIRELDRRVRLILIGRNGVTDSTLHPSSRNRIVLTGAVSYDRLQDYIAACDVMLLPLTDSVANRGRWPSKISDYLAAGRPVVTCAVGDLKELFSGAPIGALSKDEPSDFARTTLRMLDCPDLTEMGRNARVVAETRLAWDVLTDLLLALYHRVSGCHVGAAR